VLLPTIAMGATLPLVARVAGAAEGGERRVTTLYAANAGGGATGALLGVYFVIPTFGLAASLRVGASVSVAIGVAAILLGRRAEDREVEPAEVGSPAPEGGTLPWMFASAASGLLVFASEVVFVHLLALVAGTSVYAFGLVLAVFLVALSEGASRSQALVRRAGPGALAVSMALSGLALALTTPVWDHLPDLFVAAGPFVAAWWQCEVVRGLVALIAIGVPVTCMGMTFPIVLARLSAYANRGALIGRATAVNTLASIAGSLVGGFVLVPGLGSQRACGAIAIAYGLCALLMRVPGRRWIAVAAATTVVLVVAVPRWNLARLASGTNVYFDRANDYGAVVFFDEDLHGGVVTVTRRGALDTLFTNGKFQGDNGSQMTAQRGFADVPAMFAPRFGRALVIGVGTGTTLGELATYPFDRIDVAELSPGIVKAARTFFAGVNRDVFDDPRVRVRVEDGRNLLVLEDQTYDLITIELTSIWFAGAANLYNREFYAIASRRLNEGGILSQWMQLHHTSLRALASQMATARAVFAHAAFFVTNQGLLEVSQAPLVAHPRSPRELDDLVLADDTLDAFIDDVCALYGITRAALVSTDDNLLLEYATPRLNTWSTPGVPILQWRRPDVASRVGGR
jgi:spermidine synthase